MIRHGRSRYQFKRYVLCLKWILTVAVLTVAACKRSMSHDIVTTDTYTGTYVRNSYYIQNNFLIGRTSTHIFTHTYTYIIHAFLVPEASIGKPKQDICIVELLPFQFRCYSLLLPYSWKYWGKKSGSFGPHFVFLNRNSL